MWYPLFLIFIAMLPFSFALNPTSNIDLPITRLLVPIIFVFWFFGSLLKKSVAVDTRVRFFLLLVFVLISSFSIFWALDPSFSFRKVLFLFSAIPLYFVAFSATTKDEKRKKVLIVLVLSGLAVSLLALLQFWLQFFIGIDATLSIIKWYIPFFLGSSFSDLVLAFPSWLVNISGKTVLRAFGTFPDPHLFSLYVNMLIPISLYLFSLTKKRFFLIATVIMFSASILSFSRASYFSLAAGGLFFVYTSSGFFLIRKYFAAVVLTILLAILIMIVPNPLTSRFISSLNVNEGSNSGRIAMWTTAIQGIRENPWKGVGIGNFSYYVDPEINVRNPIYAHNIILDFGVETGTLNALILIVLILSPVVLCFRKQKPLNLALAVTFIIFLAHSMFETPFFSIRVFPLFCILLALNNDD